MYYYVTFIKISLRVLFVKLFGLLSRIRIHLGSFIYLGIILMRHFFMLGLLSTHLIIFLDVLDPCQKESHRSLNLNLEIVVLGCRFLGFCLSSIDALVIMLVWLWLFLRDQWKGMQAWKDRKVSDSIILFTLLFTIWIISMLFLLVVQINWRFTSLEYDYDVIEE